MLERLSSQVYGRRYEYEYKLGRFLGNEKKARIAAI
jgi:hypothetical protein